MGHLFARSKYDTSFIYPSVAVKVKKKTPPICWRGRGGGGEGSGGEGGHGKGKI